MKKIVLLYGDGTSVTKKEDRITKDDIHMADYFLIPVDDDSRSYTIIKPSKYLSFTKAIIDYQLCALYDDCEETRVVWSDNMNLVHIETTSICDVISLINCADRLNIVNKIINGDEIYEGPTQIGLSFLSVQLFSENKRIYESTYSRGNSYTTTLYDSYSITKKFKKLYSPIIIGEIWSADVVVGLITTKYESIWEIGVNIDAYSLIGIPQVDTNIITFLTQEEYDSIMKIEYLKSEFFIFHTESTLIADISSDIASGAPTEVIDEKINYLEDVYVCSDYGIVNGRGCHVVEVLSNLLFVLVSSKLIYSQMYPDLPFDNEDENLNDDRSYPQLCEFSSLIQIKFHIGEKIKTLYMNEYTFIDIQMLLYEIGKE